VGEDLALRVDDRGFGTAGAQVDRENAGLQRRNITDRP
jgi:hypothetical protein